jgi:Tfp pilus assembly protein PilO
VEKPPENALSPLIVLKWKKGDSLDIALLQASFLLGAGYNCFVVMGKASRNITTRDESKLRYHYEEDLKEGVIKLDSDLE